VFVCACQFIAITRAEATLISAQSKQKFRRPLFLSAENALTFSSIRHNDTQFSQTATGVVLRKTVLLKEEGSDTFLRNVGLHKIYTAPHPRKWDSSQSPP
jgi:hypothetical protein